MTDDSELTPESDTSLTHVNQTQRQLSLVIESFLEAWGKVDDFGPPLLRDFVPAEEPLRRESLYELIKIDLELRWQEYQLPKRLAEYCDEFPEISLHHLPVDVIYEEYLCRQHLDPSVTIREYYSAFPHHTQSLRRFAQGSHLETVIQDPGTSDHFRDYQPGDSIDDFDLLVRLGQGAFASVFLARQRSMQRLVAVKISANRGSEPQTLAQLDHEDIVRVFDQRVVSDPPLRLLYMQYLPGGTLANVVQNVKQTPLDQRSGQLLLDTVDKSLQRNGELPPGQSAIRHELAGRSWPETVAWIGIRLARALGYANRQGILHRDLKPANVLLSAEGSPKLADFNISFSPRAGSADAVAYFGGSLDYMSPEQLSACLSNSSVDIKDLDLRSDLFALGVVLWELLTGVRPFPEPETTQRSPKYFNQMLALRTAGIEPERHQECVAIAPTGLVRIFLKLLHPDRTQRWQTAEDVIAQLETILEPHARELIDPHPGSWHAISSRWIVPIVLALNLIPNALVGAANFLYNRAAILTNNVDDSVFHWVSAFINCVAFPIGIAVIVWLALRVRRAVSDSEYDRHDESIRRAALLIGHHSALVCLALWAVAGIAYPVIINLSGNEIPHIAYLHLFGSLVIFGLIATAYPFFALTLYSVEVLYPLLLRQNIGQPRNRQDLHLLQRRLRVYLGMAAAIPLLAVAALTGVSADFVGVAQALCFGGIFAFAGAFWLYRRIEDDISVLLKICPES